MAIDKIQCVAERTEARDMVDIFAVLEKHPHMQKLAMRLLYQQDALLLVERLLDWTDSSIRKDLKSYRDVDPRNAIHIRDLFLKWLRPTAKPKGS
jgi:hypothetical protein